jgi:hypothetical protein
MEYVAYLDSSLPGPRVKAAHPRTPYSVRSTPICVEDPEVLTLVSEIPTSWDKFDWLICVGQPYYPCLKTISLPPR